MQVNDFFNRIVTFERLIPNHITMKLSQWLFLFFFFSFLTAESQYDPSKIFVPDFYKHKGDNLRSASGKPSSDYWQNEADYSVKVAFNVETHLLSGNVTIEYT